jgi:hypothetical protein
MPAGKRADRHKQKPGVSEFAFWRKRLAAVAVSPRLIGGVHFS